MISCACMSYSCHVCNSDGKEHSTHVRMLDGICRQMYTLGIAYLTQCQNAPVASCLCSHAACDTLRFVLRT